MTDPRYFRFEAFADAPSAQAAFEAAYPPGSPVAPALQRLVDMGAQCRSVGPGRFACRHLENPAALAGFCWHLALEGNDEKGIQRVHISAGWLGC